MSFCVIGSHKIDGNVLWLAFSGVEPAPSHYKYNKTFHSAADFPQENPEVAIEANRCYRKPFFISTLFKFQFSKVSFYVFMKYFFLRLYDKPKPKKDYDKNQNDPKKI